MTSYILSASIKNEVEETFVTVCIAAICEGGKKIVVAADRMFTAPPPVNLEFETSEKKIEVLAPSCVTLFAGNSAFATEIIRGARKKLAGAQSPAFDGRGQGAGILSGS